VNRIHNIQAEKRLNGYWFNNKCPPKHNYENVLDSLDNNDLKTTKMIDPNSGKNISFENITYLRAKHMEINKIKSD